MVDGSTSVSRGEDQLNCPLPLVCRSFLLRGEGPQTDTKGSNASGLVLSEYLDAHNRCVPFTLCSFVDHEDPEYNPFDLDQRLIHMDKMRHFDQPQETLCFKPEDSASLSCRDMSVVGPRGLSTSLTADFLLTKAMPATRAASRSGMSLPLFEPFR